MFQTKQQKNFRITEESLLFGSWNYLKNGLLLSQFFPPFLSFVGAFWEDYHAMLPVAFPSWKASYTVYAQSLKYCASIMHFLSVYYFVMISSLLVIQQRLFEFITYLKEPAKIQT